MGLEIDFIDSDLEAESSAPNDAYVKIFDLSKYQGHLSIVDLIRKITQNSVSGRPRFELCQWRRSF